MSPSKRATARALQARQARRCAAETLPPPSTIPAEAFFDFAKMSKAIVGAINARVKSDVIVDVGVQEFTYEPVTEMRGRPAP